MGRSLRKITVFLGNIVKWTHRKITNYFPILASQEPNQKNQAQNQTRLRRQQYRKYVKEKLKRVKQKKIGVINRKNDNKKSKNILTELLKNYKNEEFSCPICMEFLVVPVSTPCGHSYCFQCLEQLLSYQTQCSVCRENIKTMEVTVCQVLSNILVRKAKVSMNENDFKQYQQRLQKNKLWQQRRKIEPQRLQIGQNIDARDADYNWCGAKICKIYKDKFQRTVSILVVFNPGSKFSEEIIETSSKRLAPYQFFSKSIQQRFLLNSSFGFLNEYRESRSNLLFEIIDDFNDQFLMGHLPIQIEQSPNLFEVRQVNNLLNAQVIIPQASPEHSVFFSEASEERNQQNQPNQNN